VFDELGTRQERLSIGLPVWLTAVAMAYTGVSWWLFVPLGIVALALVAGSVTAAAKGNTWVQLAIAAPLVAGHLAFALPERPLDIASLLPAAPLDEPARPALPPEVADASRGPYAACAYYGAAQALALDCPTCLAADSATRVSQLSTVQDSRKCERIFIQTLAHWRGRTSDCRAFTETDPRLAVLLPPDALHCRKAKSAQFLSSVL
jgi:hypothetical protein